MTPALHDALAHVEVARWPDPHKAHLSDSTIRERFKKALKRAGVREVR